MSKNDISMVKEIGQELLPEYTHRDRRRKMDREDKVLELTSRQIQICKLHCQGFSNKDIARGMKITAQNVSDVINSAKGKELILAINSFAIGDMASQQNDMDEIIANATTIVRGILDPKALGQPGGPPAGLVVKTALEVVKKSIPTNINVHKSSEVLSARAIQKIKERSQAAKMLREQSLVEEVKYQDV